MSAPASHKINFYVRSLEATRRLYAEQLKLATPAKKSVRQVTSPSSPWKGLSTVGMALILSPDPFSDIVGAPLFVIGAALTKSRSPSNLSDVYKHHQKTVQILKELKEGFRF